MSQKMIIEVSPPPMPSLSMMARPLPPSKKKEWSMANGYEEMEDDKNTGNKSEGVIAHREDLRLIRVANKAARNTTKSGDRKVVDRKVVDCKVVDRNGVKRIVRPPPAPKALWTSPKLHGGLER